MKRWIPPPESETDRRLRDWQEIDAALSANLAAGKWPTQELLRAHAAAWEALNA